jgi:hypothetical protein
MTRLTKVLFTAALSVAAMAGTALADDEPKGGEGGGGDAAGGGGDAAAGGDAKAGGDAAGGAADAAADAGVASGLTLGKGKIMVGGETVNINMSASLVAKPVSFAPGIYYGVSDKLQVGLEHDLGSSRWSPRPTPGRGICITGKEKGCAKAYNNLGLDVLFGVAQGKFSAAAHGGIEFFSLDPLFIDIKAGLLGKYDINDKIAVAFDPSVIIGATKRDEGNIKQFINVPVYLWFKANEKISAYAATGIFGPTDHFGDFYSIPVGVGGTFMVNEKISAGADFWFDNIGGKGSSADFRSLGIRFGYAM